MELSAKPQSVACSYDANYRTPNYFQDRRWLYRNFVRALVAKAKLGPGARLLDAGCGQGFFTSLFAESGLSSLGMDLSSVGIAAAQKSWSRSGAQFEVGDVRTLNYDQEFDAVFCRSCSLYNSPDFATNRQLTDALLNYVRPGGTLIFDYYSKPGRISAGWRNHSFQDIKSHFSVYPDAELYFSLRLDALMLGRFAFTPLVTRFALLASRWAPVGGELVAFVRAPRPPGKKTGFSSFTI